jgi:serine/threonine protein kinase/Tfp pilus assembly protein PilF
MFPETWARAKEIFELALAAPCANRTRLVEEHCRGDLELRGLVGDLLRGAEQTSGILDTPAADLPLFGGATLGLDQILSPGDQLAGRFRIDRLIGTGGMGDVYEAEDMALENARIAIKTIRSSIGWDPKIELQFRQEVYLARKVTHANVCRIHEFFVHESKSQADSNTNRICFYSMELVTGVALRDLLRTRRFGVAQAIGIISQLASGLAAAHASDVVHGDFKTANVLIVETGNSIRAVITDFGLAKQVRSTNAEAEMGLLLGGTPEYMAPELYRGQTATPASDVFSFGVVAVETLTGNILPSAANEVGVDREAVRAALQDIPSRLRDVIVRCLSTSPADRFADGSSLLQEWQNALTSRANTYSRRAWIFAIGGGAAGIVTAREFGLLRFQSSKPMLAVLPFRALSAEVEALADGLADRLITNLSGARSVRVIARSSSFQYKGTQQRDMLAFAQQIGADLLLNAEVSLERQAYQVIAHLYQSRDGRQLWRQTFTAGRQASFELQQQIVAAVLRRLQIAFSPPLRNPPDPAAHEAYLIGNYYWNKRDPESLKRALESFETATRVQPDYAEAWAGVADTYQMLGNTSFTLPEATAHAKDAARRALALDDQLAEAHMTAALISHRFDWDWQAAIREFQRAIDLEPQNARAHHWYAGTLSDLGYADAAIGEIGTAHVLDPLSFAVDTAAVMYLGAARRFDQAIAKGKRVIQVEPQYFRVYPFLALAYLGAHDFPHAMEAYERGYQLAPTDPYMQAHLAYACFLAGETERASKIFDELLRRPIPPPPFYVAIVYCGSNDRANALRWLERAYEDRDPSITMIKVHPALDPVRGEPRYLSLLQKMNL